MKTIRLGNPETSRLTPIDSDDDARALQPFHDAWKTRRSPRTLAAFATSEGTMVRGRPLPETQWVENKAMDWAGLASDDGRYVHILCQGCPVEEAAAQVIAHVLAKYGARTVLTSWKFELRPHPHTPTQQVVHFRADENGDPLFGL